MPILLLFAIAIDYSQYLTMNRQLASATDAAALAAVKQLNLASSALTKLCQSVVQANYPPAAASPIQVSCAPLNGDAYSMKVTATGSMSTSFLQLFGYNSLALNASSTAVPAINYFNIYTAVDMSGSLGIAADATNRALLQRLTKRYTTDPEEKSVGCEFACHYADPGNVRLPNNETTYNFAIRHGVSLREDVLKTAFSNFVAQVFTTNPNMTVQRKVDVIGFSGFALPASDPSMIQDLTGGPTGNQSTAANALSSYTGARWGAQYRWALPLIASHMGPQGDGYTAGTPLKMLVLITDGVEDDRATYIKPGPVDMPIDLNSGNPETPTQNCADIKNSGITIAVIDVKYLDSTSDYWFNYWFSPFISAWNSTIYGEISPALQQCASGGWYFSATDSADIDAALTQLLNKINTTSLRIIK
jgi:hypothetical protein